MATASGIRIGRAFVQIDAVDNTGRVLRRVGANMQRYARSVQNWGQRALIGGVLGNMGTALAVKQFTDLDDILRRVQAKSSGTAAQMNTLRKMTKSLALETGIAATQIATLMEELGTKGYNYAEIAKMTKPVLQLSKAGGKTGSEEDQILAASAVSQVLQSFGLNADQAQNVADQLAVALNESNFALEDLLITMSYLGPTAKSFGADSKSVLAMGALLRDVGVNASIAGTAIRNMYLQMSAESNRTKFNERLTELGGNKVNFIDKAGNLRPLAQIMKDIGHATKNLGSADKSDLFGQLFGLRALVPAMMISSKLIDETDTRFSKLLEELDKADGTVDRTADLMNGGLGGAMRRAWQGVNILAIEWGEKLAPLLTSGARIISEIANETIVWVGANQKTVVAITAVIALLPVVGVGMMLFGYAMYMAGTAAMFLGSMIVTMFTVATTVLAILTMPVSLPFIATLLVAIPATIALLWAFYNLIQMIGKTDAFAELSAWFGNLFSIAKSGFAEMSEDATKWSSLFITALSDGNINVAMRALTNGLEAMWMDLRDSTLGMLDEITFAIYAVYNAWKDTAVAIGETTGAGSVEGMGLHDDAKGLDAKAMEINVRRGNEINSLLAMKDRTPEQEERLQNLKAAGVADFKGADRMQGDYDQAYKQELDAWKPDMNLDPAARKKKRDEDRQARKDELENERNALELGLQVDRETAEMERLSMFTGEESASAPKGPQGLPATPGGVASMPLSPGALQASMAGTFGAFDAYVKNRSGGKSTEELLEEQNGKHDEEIALLGSIKESLGNDEGGEYTA